LNREKVILKKNFAGIPYRAAANNKCVDFIAVGGIEALSDYPCAVVSYFTDQIAGTYIASEHHPDSQGYVLTFADSPVPLGECGAVHVRFYEGNPVNWLVCIGGRMLMPDGSYKLHEKPFILDLDFNTWLTDVIPPIPTPRYNAGVSQVVTTTDTNPETNETTTNDRIFVICGRAEAGLTSKIESLNLTTGQWETHWNKF
jgi:hypothetical protein